MLFMIAKQSNKTKSHKTPNYNSNNKNPKDTMQMLLSKIKNWLQTQRHSHILRGYVAKRKYVALYLLKWKFAPNILLKENRRL